jgi:hypothetical protein
VHGLGQIGARVLELRHRELHVRIGATRPVEHESAERPSGLADGHGIGLLLHTAEDDALGHGAQRRIAQSPEGTGQRRDAEAERRGVTAAGAEREDTQHDDRGPLTLRQQLQQRASDEQRLGQDRVDVAAGDLLAHCGELGGAGPDEQVAHVEAQCGRPGEADAFGERGIRIVEVDVGIRRECDELRSGRGHAVGVADAGQEAHLVAALDEVARDLQQRQNVAVRRRTGDEVGGHEPFFP